MLQQIPNLKIVAVDIGHTDHYVLCHGRMGYGYFITCNPKPHEVLFLNCENEVRRVMSILDMMTAIIFDNAVGNDVQILMKNARVSVREGSMVFPEPESKQEPKPEEKQYAYRFVNGDGNYLRFASAHPGYYIDSNGPASHIVMYYDEQAANDFLADMRRRGLILKNLSGEVVNSDLTVFIRPNEMWS